MAAGPTAGSPEEPDPLPAELVCSARGCRQPAAVDLQWNNPKIHPPGRRKHWLACPQHQPTLSAFLSARGLLREVLPLTADR